MTTPRSKSPSQQAAYADLFERLLDCTLLLDPTTQLILEANSACEAMFGVPAEKLVGRSLIPWVEADRRGDFEKGLRVAMRRYHPRLFDSRFKFADGRLVQVEVQACPLQLADGSEVLQLITRDVSFKREAEAKMQALLRDLQIANAKLEVLSTVDEMTGLFNFRHFKSEFEKEHIRGSRYSTPYSIVFIDIDHFKKYNDRNGHPAGDQLLREFAKVLTKCCRTSDILARYGGEEFAIICPGVNTQGAAILAERIRTAVAMTGFVFREHQPLGYVSVSIGVSSFPENGLISDQVLKAADDAVYLSKTQGRDRVTLASPLFCKSQVA